MLEFAQKVVKPGILTQKPGKKRENCKFFVSSFTFQDVIYKNNFDLLLCHIYIINTNTALKPIWPWISLLLHGNNLENNGILCHKRSGNSASVLTHFEIFITKICMKVPGIWHKKPWKIWILGPKILRKPGIWYFEKSGNPDNVRLLGNGLENYCH